ncbi:hypothetical protein PS042_19565 [Escherichia albertii]|uniref:Uncharacterized protein n=1 Tax=Escherichia albertii TaxID=208962 RepID=A0AAX3MM33_ESCAL|nr:hypothetical protein [Escherichia albertii]MCU7267775.1 hypothetical protein [Escherichia albertii]MCU7276449.1 hypothetical protein [Escherichia albertii]MCU7312618.1 hypothetical protein [Escherichia albertii]MCU7316924.1 hypothetical protein [Escherichia albertii]MCU7323502.1 hypothetical protein [Escherichia albertii]
MSSSDKIVWAFCLQSEAAKAAAFFMDEIEQSNNALLVIVSEK